MANVRICIVGGGSYNWSPTLLQDLAALPDLSGAVILHDIDAHAAEEMCQLGGMLMAAAGADFRVEAEPDLPAALRDADFVIVTITTGGLDAMRHDLEIPASYGIAQSVGDTVGPGGLSRALRNIPVLVEIARTMERVCPDAWLLNLTNPMTTLVRAVAKVTSIKVIGLCHELFGVRRVLMRLCNATVDDVDLQVGGINHLIWLLEARVRDQDGLQLVRDHLAQGGSIPFTPRTDPALATFQDRWQIKRALFDVYGALPAAGDRHLAEFFPYFLGGATNSGADFGVLLTRIDHRRAIQEAARSRVRAWLDGSAPLATRPSEEEVAPIIAAITKGRPRKTVVNLPNHGQIDNLPRDAVVETMGMVGADGAHAISIGALPPGILATVYPHVVNQELIVESALTGNRRLALQALVGDPLVPDIRTAPRLLDDLLHAHAAYLPAFAS